jgi:UDP-N-acetylglucosamine 2-epimerase (non-hydrolysing)
MDKSYLIITDSGGVQEDAPSLGKPVLVMRDITPAIKHHNPDMGARRAVPRLGEATLAPTIDMFNCPHNTTERPDAVTAGTVKLVGTSKELIIRETAELLCNQSSSERMSQARNPYGDGLFASRICARLP